MRRVTLLIDFDVDDDTPDDHILSVCADAVVQIEEPIFSREDDGTDVQGKTYNVRDTVSIATAPDSE